MFIHVYYFSCTVMDRHTYMCHGFTAFICWPLQPENTPSMSHMPKTDAVDLSPHDGDRAHRARQHPEYPGTSWVTMGMKVGQMAAPVRLQRLRLADDRGEHHIGRQHDLPDATTRWSGCRRRGIHPGATAAGLLGDRGSPDAGGSRRGGGRGVGRRGSRSAIGRGAARPPVMTEASTPSSIRKSSPRKRWAWMRCDFSKRTRSTT